MTRPRSNLDSDDPAGTRLSWGLDICDRSGVRRTAVRERILSFLAKQRVPVTLDRVAQSEEVQGRCDETTVYRTLMLFVQMELVRQIRLRNRLSYFVLNAPDGHLHFLICRCCGAVTELPCLEGAAQLETQARKIHGYAHFYHVFELHGVCPACQPARKSLAPVVKLPIKSSPVF